MAVPVLFSRDYPYRVTVHNRTHSGGWVLSYMKFEAPPVAKSDKFATIDDALAAVKELTQRLNSAWGNEAVIIDGSLNEILRVNLSEQIIPHAVLAVSPDNQTIALTSANGLKLFDRKGNRLYMLPHRAWDNNEGSECFFTSDGLLWFVRPGEKFEDAIISVLDTRAKKLVAEHRIEHPYGVYRFSPTKQGIFIAVSRDGEGDLLFSVEMSNRRLNIKSRQDLDKLNKAVMDISPSGQEILCVDSSEESLYKLDARTGRQTGALDRKVAFAGDPSSVKGFDDRFGNSCVFLTEDRLLMKTQCGRLILIDVKSMSVIGTVWPDGYHLYATDDQGKRVNNLSEADEWAGDIWYVFQAPAGRVLAEYNGETLKVLEVNSLIPNKT